MENDSTKKNKAWWPNKKLLKRHHLLWALLSLKVYAMEAVICDMCGSNRKTFQKWTKIYVKEIARLAPKEASENQQIKKYCENYVLTFTFGIFFSDLVGKLFKTR